MQTGAEERPGGAHPQRRCSFSSLRCTSCVRNIRTASFERSTSREKPRFGVSTRCPSSEIERVRGAYLASGKGDVRRFNDAVAGSGALPIALAERAVMG